MRYDAHLHLWDNGVVPHHWMTGTSLPTRHALDDVALPADTRVIAVEAGPDPDQRLAETEWLAAQAAEDQRIAAVVAALPQCPTASYWHLLDTHPVIRGVRGLALGDDLEALETVDALVERGLVLDVAVGWLELASVADLAAARPHLRIVLDHCAHPRPGDDIRAWATAMADLAAFPGVAVKLSGISPPTGTALDSWATPIVDHVLRCFGPQRCLAGSDWPVTNHDGQYTTWFDALRRTTRAEAHADIFGRSTELAYLGGPSA